MYNFVVKHVAKYQSRHTLAMFIGYAPLKVSIELSELEAKYHKF